MKLRTGPFPTAGGTGYSGSGASSPGQLPVSAANARRDWWSTTARTARKMAPSSAAAIRTLPRLTWRCSASGGSSSSIIPQACSNSFLPRKPAIRPPATLKGMNSSFTPGKLPGAATGYGSKEDGGAVECTSGGRGWRGPGPEAARRPERSPDEIVGRRPQAHRSRVPRGQPQRLGCRAHLLRDPRDLPRPARARLGPRTDRELRYPAADHESRFRGAGPRQADL